MGEKIRLAREELRAHRGSAREWLRRQPPEVQGDRETALLAVNRDGLALEHASPELKADKEVVLAAVTKGAFAIQFADPVLLVCRDFAISAVQCNGFALACLPDALKADRDVVLAAVQEAGGALEYASRALQADALVALAAVRQGEEALEHVAQELWGEVAFVAAAAEVNSAALGYASAPIQADRRFILLIAQRNPGVLEAASASLLADRAFLLDTVQNNVQALEHLPERFKVDPDFVIAAAAQNPRVLPQTAGWAIWEDKSFVLAAAAHFGDSFAYAVPALRANREFVLEVVGCSACALAHAALNLQADADLVLAAIARNPAAFAFAAERFRSDPNFALRAVRHSAAAADFVADSLWQDPYFVLEAVSLPLCPSALARASEPLRSDFNFVIRAVQVRGQCLGDAAPELTADRRLLDAAVIQDPAALAGAAAELRADRSTVLPVVQRAGTALQYAAETLRADAEVVLAAVGSDPEAMQFASAALRGDARFALCAVHKHGAALAHATAKLRADGGFILQCLENQPCAIQYAAESLLEDTSFCLRAIRAQPQALGFLRLERRTDLGFVQEAVRANWVAARFAPASVQGQLAVRQAASEAQATLRRDSMVASACSFGLCELSELEEGGSDQLGGSSASTALPSQSSAGMFDFEELEAMDPQEHMVADQVDYRSGSFSYTGIPDDLDSLRLEELEALYEQLGLPLEPSMLADSIRARLAMAREWGSMKVPALKAECAKRGLPCEAALQRTLVRRLLTQECLGSWRALGVSAARCTSVQEAARSVRGLRRAHGLPCAMLRADVASLGVFVGSGAEPPELRRVLEAVAIWQGLTLLELRKECQLRGLSTSHVYGREEDSRRLLLETLLERFTEESLRQSDIPLQRFETLDAARRVAEERERLKGLGRPLLLELCSERGLPAEACVEWYSHQDLLTRLQLAALWDELPVAELEKECASRGLAPLPAAVATLGVAPGKRRSDLHDWLMADSFAGVFEGRWGIPVRDLRSVQAAGRVLKRWERLAGSSVAELAKEFESLLGVPPCAPRAPHSDVDKRSLLEGQLREAAVWTVSPISGLLKACERLGLPTRIDTADMHSELLERLLRTLCNDIYAERGVDTRQLGSLKVARGLLGEWARLDRSSAAELLEEYRALGTPPGQWKNGVFHAGPPQEVPTNTEELRKRLRAVAYWRSLPYEELQRVCWETGCRSLYFESFSEIKGDRHLLVAALVGAGIWNKVSQTSTRGAEAAPHRQAPPQTQAHQAPRQPAPPPPPPRPCHADAPAAGAVHPAPPQQPSAKPSPGRRVQQRVAAGRLRVARHFEALELSPDASVEDVKRAFRKLALRYHPDKNVENGYKGGDAEQFRSVAEAYNALIDYFKGGP